MGREKGAANHLLAWHGVKRKPRLPQTHWGEIPELWISISIRKEGKLLGLGGRMNKNSNKKNEAGVMGHTFNLTLETAAGRSL